MSTYKIQNKSRGNYAFNTKSGVRTVSSNETVELDLAKALSDERIGALALEGLTISKVTASKSGAKDTGSKEGSKGK
ncbi:hypothetical protein [Litorimonas haliclonae]|uniref:hypothetical protein n=1 Tax=Litorimonas haliclonae TaxID=2081977 RepID=UPI0039EE8462